MSADDADDSTAAASRDYLLLGLAALGLSAVTLLACGARGMAMVPNLFGALGLGFRRRWAAGLYLIALAVTVVNPFGGMIGVSVRPSPLTDLLLTAATLAYLLAQFRLLSLTAGSVPADPRRPLGLPPGQRPPVVPPPDRPAASVPPVELPYALLTVLLFALLPPTLWWLANEADNPLRVSWQVWRLAVVLWVVGGTLLAVRVILGSLAWGRMTVAEARLFLLDTLWRETRGELTRVARWRAKRSG